MKLTTTCAEEETKTRVKERRARYNFVGEIFKRSRRNVLIGLGPVAAPLLAAGPKDRKVNKVNKYGIRSTICEIHILAPYQRDELARQLGVMSNFIRCILFNTSKPFHIAFFVASFTALE